MSSSDIQSRLNEMERRAKTLKLKSSNLDIKEEYFLQKAQDFFKLVKKLDKTINDKNFELNSNKSKDLDHTLLALIEIVNYDVVDTEELLNDLKKIIAIYNILREYF